MCLHENICNQSSHRDFQSVNLKCELKEIQNFSKGMNLETLFKKIVTVRYVQHFPVLTINLTDLHCQSLVMSAFQKLLHHKLKLQLNLKKPQVLHMPCPYCFTTTILNLRLLFWFLVSYMLDLFWGLLNTTLGLFSHQACVHWFAGRNMNSAHF